MVKPELGDKQICPNCGSKFYDLLRRPAHCPKCHTEFDPGDETVRAKRVKSTRAPTYERSYEDDEETPRPEAEDMEDEEAEDTPEIDAEADSDAPLVEDDEDEPSSETLPEGFSEDEGISDEEAPVEDDDAPILDIDDEDDAFEEEELGEIAEGEDEGEERS